jgi:CPA1 family monovalent cation:H+ antiporter
MPLSESVLLLMVLLAIGVLVRGLFSRLPIPYTVLLVVLGMLLGNLARVWQPLESIRYFHLSPELVFFIFLPVLIFESGLSLHARQLAKDIVPVLMLAIPALLVSTTIVGLGVWMLLPLDLTTALLFGALISATDPVAVVSLFKELGTPTRLTTLVEGESLLNDATAIVLFSILLGLAVHGEFAVSDIGAAILEFLRVFLGGALLGLIFGLLLSRLVIRLHLETSSVLVSSLILAYVSFIVAEHGLHVSGVMAVVAAALSFSLVASPRLAEATGHALRSTWEFLADITNTLLFLLIGMAVNLQALAAASGFILMVGLLVIAARGVSVYSFVPLTVKLFKLPAVTLGERHIMWWGGLKGGLAIAIVLSIPADLPGRELLLNLTLGVVLLSLLINAPTIRPLIERLGLDRLSEDENIELDQAASQVRSLAGSILRKLRDNRVLSGAGKLHAEREVSQSLQWPLQDVSDESFARKQHLNVLREESRELEHLFNAGVVPQYSFLDIKAELQRESDQLRNPGRSGEGTDAPASNLFIRFENALIRRLRESNWASNLLARYQNMRISQHVVRDLVRILMAEAALEYARQQLKTDPRFDPSILPRYREKLRLLHENIAEYQRDFEEFYRRFEGRFAKRTVLISVLRYIQREQRKGVISTKVYAVLEQAIHRALDQVPAITEPVPGIRNEDLIGLVPLFSGLSDDALKGIAVKAASVNYLPGDIIIGQGEHGDSLYIVVRGRVRVSHAENGNSQTIADLVVGDFFGEMALLGGHVRQATVTALHTSTLLRLKAQDVLEISRRFPEIGEYLNELKQDREGGLDHAVDDVPS